LRDKLISAIELLERSTSKYKFYSSNSTNVDSELKVLDNQDKYKTSTFGNNIISSHVLGCTSVFSRDVMHAIADCYDIVIHYPDHLLPYHDAYATLVAFALDSYIIFDSKSHILYRQHGKNLVGGGGQSLVSAQMDRLSSPYRRFTKIRILLASVNHELIKTDNLKLLQQCADSNKTLKTRIKLIKDRRLRGDDWKHTIFFWINLLLKKW